VKEDEQDKRSESCFSYESQGLIGLLDQVKLEAFLGLCDLLYSSIAVLANGTNEEGLSKCCNMT
jgi:hypothetical protein